MENEDQTEKQSKLVTKHSESVIEHSESKVEIEQDPKKKQFFKQDSYTNGQEITVDVLTPIKISNSGKISIEKNKPKVFVGKAPIDMGGRIIPFNFIIDGANNFLEAINRFDDSCNKSLKEANKKREKEMEAMKNQQNIVVPGGTGGKIIAP